MIINGVVWRVRLVSPAHPLLLTPWKTHALGVCDKVTKTICVDKTLSPQLLKEVLCHEIVHAFFNESGLQDNSFGIDNSWARNEEMVDWIAIQGAKIYKAWQDADAL